MKLDRDLLINAALLAFASIALVNPPPPAKSEGHLAGSETVRIMCPQFLDELPAFSEGGQP